MLTYAEYLDDEEYEALTEPEFIDPDEWEWHSDSTAGAHFTCFTGTKVQILARRKAQNLRRIRCILART